VESGTYTLGGGGGRRKGPDSDIGTARQGDQEKEGRRANIRLTKKQKGTEKRRQGDKGARRSGGAHHKRPKDVGRGGVDRRQILSQGAGLGTKHELEGGSPSRLAGANDWPLALQRGLGNPAA